MMITKLTIGGMTSIHAVRAIFTALTAVEGITRADVTLAGTTIEHDGRATPSILREAIALAGYEVVDTTEVKRSLPLL
ncbi:MAG: heavy-metal-associated domain-containing protein [Gemmatimonadota bacterium]|nr:heavy-metal-associated domain-containing protein [Gemmatimonadota bacterium]